MTDRSDPSPFPAGTEGAGSGRRVSIRQGMLFLLVLALLPLAALALFQGMARLDADNQQLSDRLRENVLFAARVEQNVINNSAGLLMMLAENPLVRNADAQRCSDKLREIQQLFPTYANFTMIAADGLIRCAAVGLEQKTELPVRPWLLEQVRRSSSLYISPPILGEYTHRRVVVMARPLHDSRGRFQGALTASVDLDYLQQTLRRRYPDDDMVVMLLDTHGRPLASSRQMGWNRLDVSGQQGAVHQIRDVDGQPWVYALGSIVNGNDGRTLFHIAYASRRARLAEPDWWFIGGHIALPVLALVFASAAILIGVQWGILRWIGSLRALAAEYARGNYRARDNAFQEAPQELRDLAASFYRMAHTIEQRDRTLHDAMDRQAAMAREINHRVKNNLQIIISLLSLQARTVEDDSARAALASARLRVGALALVHRLLYATDELGRVSTMTLIGDLCGLVEQHHALSHVRLSCSGAQVMIDIDHAVPLTLWWVETVSDALSRSAAVDHPVEIAATIELDDDHVVARVADNAGNGAGGTVPALPRLLGAIARQLGGRVHYEDDHGQRTVTLRFPAERTRNIGG
jgi:two-component sensor histidine kinase